MKQIITFLITLFILRAGFSQETPYEKNKLTTTTYAECIKYYKSLEKTNDIIKVIECGETDIGKPLHLVIVSKDKLFTPEEIHKSGKVVLLVNNGIHPGEPDGIDASMMFVRDLARGLVKINDEETLHIPSLLDNVVLIVIPIYNIDGVMNRNNFTRVNQVGPLEYGFRGNAENRDMNRDFIKLDTKNAMAFVQIFQEWKPELFVDTHTTDGADYTYTMTYIVTEPYELEEPVATYIKKNLVPYLEKDMKSKKTEICPYVTTYKSTPDSGIVSFPETPRFSTGYAALFNTIGFVSESHMLKTHSQRVEAAYQFLVSLIRKAGLDYKTIIENKSKADELSKKRNEFTLVWKVNELNPSKIMFKGYDAKYKPSVISGFERLYYDKNSPYEKEINFYDSYNPVVTIQKPIAYIVPQGWWQVINRLKLNGVDMKRLTSDQTIQVESYYIDTFNTRIPPYEGHYLHSKVNIAIIEQTRKFFAGDYVVFPDQPCNKFIVHVLEPQSSDSYFNWNFFDAVLQQKEYFDEYLFEDIADSLLGSKPGLREQFDEKKQTDEKFRNDGYAQLKFIYDNTIREPEYMRYPVARMVAEQKLLLK